MQQNRKVRLEVIKELIFVTITESQSSITNYTFRQLEITTPAETAVRDLVAETSLLLNLGLSLVQSGITIQLDNNYSYIFFKVTALV